MTQLSGLKLFHPYYIKNLKRLGNDFDGGYIVHVPTLKSADVLLNYGIGYNVEFEKDFYRETMLPTLAFDPTLKSPSLVVEKLKKGDLINFLRHSKNYVSWFFREKGLKNYKINFIQEGIGITDSQDYKSLSYHFKKYDLYNKRVILKIDVEGAEYDIFNDNATYEILPNAIQILLEFHYIEKNIENLKEIIKNISKTHSLIHIHANNHAGTFKHEGKDVPEAMEITFILNTLLTDKVYSDASYPIPGLDQPCDRLKADLDLNFFY